MTLTERPDIILVTETWCNNTVQSAALAIAGYQLEDDLRRDRADTTRGVGGGLVVYSRLGLKILSVDKFEKIGFNQLCAFHIVTTSGPLCVILTYRPPSSGADNTELLCEVLKNVDTDTILIGDINMPGVDWERGRGEGAARGLVDVIQQEGLQQLVRFPTHTKGNILDLVITNCADKIIDIKDAGRLGKSDHCMLNIRVLVEWSGSLGQANRLNWRRANYPKMRQELEGVKWDTELWSRSVEEAWRYLVGEINNSVKRHVPEHKLRNKVQPSWMTTEIMRLIRQKKRRWHVVKLHNTRENMEEYQRVEKAVKTKIRNAKRKIERDLVRNPGKNNNKFTRYIKSKTKSRSAIGPLVDENGRTLVENKEMAEALNRYFKSVFTREDTSDIPVPRREGCESMPETKIEKQEIRKAIKNLRTNAAPGPDGVTPGLMKELGEAMVTPLEIIYNRSLDEGAVPEDWKSANVCPIYKKGAKGAAGNYRPVSLTSVPCKVLETILKARLMTHLRDKGLIKNSQHGFMPARSCTTNLITFMDKVTELMDKGIAVDVFYLDFAKAFDKVPHQRLLRKLDAKGVGGKILRWIGAWLADRKQRVVVGSDKSEWETVDSGVPQGSVLGPCLFDVYIDDLEDEIREAELEVLVSKFADDTKGMKEMNCAEDRVKMQQALDSLCSWADKWGMAFNVSKCKIMHIGRNNPEHEYYMNGERLAVTEEEKDIGVIVNKSLKPSNQCTKAGNVASAILKQILRNFHYKDRHTFVKLYKQYVRPHLEFATPAWSPWMAGDRATLERVQEKAVRAVAGLKGRNYEERCKELNLDTLELRRVKQDMMEVYKMKMGEDLRYGVGMLPSVSSAGARTRTSADPLNLQKQYARTDVRKHSFGVRVVDVWNELRTETKNASTRALFKKMLDDEWKG